LVSSSLFSRKKNLSFTWFGYGSVEIFRETFQGPVHANVHCTARATEDISDLSVRELLPHRQSEHLLIPIGQLGKCIEDGGVLEELDDLWFRLMRKGGSLAAETPNEARESRCLATVVEQDAAGDGLQPRQLHLPVGNRVEFAPRDHIDVLSGFVRGIPVDAPEEVAEDRAMMLVVESTESSHCGRLDHEPPSQRPPQSLFTTV
jgi:hypothetical protein